MASIFEELMGVNATLTESARPARRTAKKVNERKMIPVKNIKVESRKIFEETDFDDLDQQFAAAPSEENPDEVVLVIDPELPSDQEAPEDVAEEMVGDLVYKCPVCGSNYVCSCGDEMSEGIDTDENGIPTECPVCGDDADQILIGEIAPAEGAGEKVNPDPVESEDLEDEDLEELPTEEDIDEEGLDDDPVEESLKEDFGDDVDDSALELEVPIEEPVAEKEPTPAVEVNNSTVTLLLDDAKFESLMTKMIRENYKGNPMFKITRCSLRDGKLRLEYFVREGRKVTKGVLVGEGFDKTSRKMQIKFVDKGAFTESFAKSPSFIVECVRVRNAVTPLSVKYNYKVRVNESLYRVSGSVGLKKQVSESFHHTR